MLWYFGLEKSASAWGYGHVRLALAALTAFAVSMILGRWMIKAFLRRRVIEDTSQPDHAGLNAIQSQKKGIPTLGGLMMVAGILAALVLWADLSNTYVLLGMLCMVLLCALGFVDDTIKLKGTRRGLKKRTKLVVQCVIAVGVGYLLTRHVSGMANGTSFCEPVTGWRSGEMGIYFVAWATFVMVAASNAVNLTDGLDGLAAGCTGIAAAVFCVVALVAAQPLAEQKSFLVAVEGAAELGVFCAAILGAALGFLWYNAHPAQIFMGDTGSLALGGLLGFIGLALKLDSLLFLVCAVFFLDELTVALQILSYKTTRRRIFPITPIHYYFQIGPRWPEEKITSRFWIVAVLAGFASLVLVRARGAM